MAVKVSLNDLNKREASLVRAGFPISKWILFCRVFLEKQWRVSMYEAPTTHSKYIYVRKGAFSRKVRFSDHKPNINKEMKQDCDIWVGAKNLEGKWINWQDAVRIIEEDYANYRASRPHMQRKNDGKKELS